MLFRQSKHRKLNLESLEVRRLMANDLSASVNMGTLSISGSAGNDRVSVVIGSQSTVVRNLNTGGAIGTFANSAYSSVRANMGNGTDTFELNANNLKTLDSVFVNMGGGSKEGIYIHSTRMNNLNIDARNAFGTGVTLTGIGVTGTANIDFGNDAARDWINIHSNSSINRLQANMGGGDDIVTLRKTSIATASIDLGSGNDEFGAMDNSFVGSGVIDGGDGTDRVRTSGARVGARLNSFER